jgi:hypothetical protein
MAKEWVEENAGQLPGFCGAYLAGTLSHLNQDASFPSYQDVDVNVVVNDLSQIPARKTQQRYQGLVVDGEFHSVEAYRSPETVLSSAENAPNVVAGRILADPQGLLAELLPVVEREYGRRKWVQARCNWEKQLVMEHLQAIQPESSCGDVFEELIWVVLGLAGLVAVAALKPPTTRRCLALAREILHAAGRPELQEALLQVWGCAHVKHKDVQFCLEACIQAFDQALSVIQAPCYGVQRDLYPYLVEGSREMMAAGHQREAMFWIMLMHSLSNRAVQRDGSEAERALSQAALNRVLVKLGLGTLAERRARLELATSVTARVFEFADEEVMRYPG